MTVKVDMPWFDEYCHPYWQLACWHLASKHWIIRIWPYRFNWTSSRQTRVSCCCLYCDNLQSRRPCLRCDNSRPWETFWQASRRTSFTHGTHRKLFDTPQTKTNVNYIYWQADPSLRRGSGAARLLGWRVRIPQGEWMSLPFECCVLSGRDLCDELITRPEEV